MADGFSERYGDLLYGSYDCVDRIVLNAYHPMVTSPAGFALGGDGCTARPRPSPASWTRSAQAHPRPVTQCLGAGDGAGPDTRQLIRAPTPPAPFAEVGPVEGPILPVNGKARSGSERRAARPHVE